MAASATIQVQFGAESAYSTRHLSAQIDTREDGLNNGKSSFSPGEMVAFLVFEGPGVTHDYPVCSAGSVALFDWQGEGLLEEHDVMFQNNDSVTVGKPIAELLNVTWVGRSLGDLTLQDDKLTLRATNEGVAVARIEYRTVTPKAYVLQSPQTIAGLSDYAILVYIEGHET